MSVLSSATLSLAAILAAPPEGPRSPGESPEYARPSAAQPVDRSAASNDSRTEPRVSRSRQAASLRRETSRLLRLEATAEGTARARAVQELVAHYRRLDADKSLARDERKRLLGKVRIRLRKVADEIEARGAAPRTVRLPANVRQALGQQLNQLGAGMARGAGVAADAPGEALLELIKTTIRPESWDDRGGPGSAILFQRFGQAGQQVGRGVAAGVNVMQGGGFAAGRPGGGAADDLGPELVDLIQQVIAPDSWDVNGGPGAIYYFRGLRVLVVRQTAEVHDGLGDALGQLRRAGN